jgi:iron(III) transport system permease protein
VRASASRGPATLGVPVALAVVLLNVYPLAWLAVGSVLTAGGFGFDHYRELYSRLALLAVLGNSWIYALGTTILALALGVPLALLVARTDVPGKTLIRLGALLAFVSPPWLGAMAYVFLASPNAGTLNVWLDALLGVKPFNVHSMTGMIFVSALFLYSFVFLTVEAALAGVDASYEEAARVAGAPRWRVLTRVTLPLVTPSVTAAAEFAFIISWGLFATPAILGMPARIHVFATQLYLLLNAFPPRLGLSAALAMVFCLSAGGLALALWPLRRRAAAGRYAVIAGRGGRPTMMELGRGRWLAGVAALGVNVLAVGIPYAMTVWMSLNTSWFGAPGLAHLSLANYVYVLAEYPNLWRVLGNSIALAAGGSALVLAVGTGVAYVRSRTLLPGRDLLAAAASYTLLLPSVAFVTGVIWAWIRPPFALYGTLALIALAQAARVLPIVVRNMEDGLGQIDRALEEAGRACGAGRVRVFFAITFPLARFVALATFTLAFLASLRDLNTPLFLGGGAPGTLTLSVVIFSFWSESRLGESAALTVLVLVLTVAVFLPIYRRFPRAL